MNKAEWALLIIMRWVGTVAFLAVGAIVMPHSWMAAVNRGLGLAELPGVPLIEYLTRSASALYAGHGILFWIISGDLRRYRRLVTYSGLLMFALGVVLLLIDILAPMPWYWTAVEGPFLIVVGAVMTILSRGIKGNR